MSETSINYIVYTYNDTECKSLAYISEESLPSVSQNTFTCDNSEVFSCGKSEVSDAIANPAVKLMYCHLYSLIIIIN